MSKVFKERGNTFFRLLDRYVGIPLVFISGIFRKKHPLPQNNSDVNRIVLVKMGAIGDSILTFPVIQKMKSTYNDVQITVICGKNNDSVYHNLLQKKGINHIIYLELGRLIYDWPYLFRKIKEIRASHYDICFDFDSWSRISALIASAVKADYKTGFRKKNQFKHYGFDHYELHQNNRHEFDNYKKLAGSFVGDIKKRPVYPTSRDDAIFFEKFISDHKIDKYIVLHPWASGYKNQRKELDVDSLVFIGKEIIEQGYTIIITGGTADVSKSESLALLLGTAFSVAGKTNLNETAIFLKNACCVVTVNTGILHLAAAVNSRIVSINGPTDVNRWGPLCDDAVNINSHLFCSPCLDLGFEYKCKENGVAPGYCMKKINLNEIVNAALK